MSQTVFNSMELDAIGELMNISLGSSATAVSNMLDHRVDITTPKVQVVSVEDFSIGELEPAIGIEIKYVSGLEGSNIMLLKRSDVKTIVDILMGSETPDDEFELNELTISAVCEVMNQMMGAASTALSDFLGYPVNISTPQSFALDDIEQFKKDHFPTDSGNLVVVRFMLGIENVLKSEFVNVMSVDLARELLAQEQPDFKQNKKQILEEIQADGRELLAKMGLSERANHYPSQLSGGQQQRVAIARALALHPDILCFDEPTSALDPELTGEVLRVIRELAEQRTTMIIVTHEMAFARDVADQVIFMDGGVIVEQGDAHQVIEHPREERTRQFLARYSEG